MRKLGFSLFSCMALVAFMGLSGTALAAVDPSCDGDPYDNTPAVHDFSIVTENNQAGAVSGLRGGGLACGTNVTILSTGTVYDHADVKDAPGVVINNTSGMANGRFVGTSVINVASQYLGVVLDQASVLTIEQISDTDDTSFSDDCEDETPVGGDIAGTIIACYRGQSALGYNHNWTTVDASGDKWLTIGPFHTTGIAGLTHIKQFNLCGNVGAAGGTPQYPADCGNSSQPFLQKNGDRSVPRTKADGGGLGVYTVTATMRNGTTTPAASTRVNWYCPTAKNGSAWVSACEARYATAPPFGIGRR